MTQTVTGNIRRDILYRMTSWYRESDLSSLFILLPFYLHLLKCPFFRLLLFFCRSFLSSFVFYSWLFCLIMFCFSSSKVYFLLLHFFFLCRYFLHSFVPSMFIFCFISRFVCPFLKCLFCLFLSYFTFVLSFILFF